MSFITNATLQAAILDAIKKASTDPDIPAHLPNIAAAANTRAYAEIRRRLLLLGYSQAQIDAWDEGAEFQRDIGLFLAFLDESLAEDYSSEFIKMKDRRDEISQLAVLLVAGARVTPQTLTGVVGTGALDTSQDMFVRDPNDTRRGNVTQW